MITTPEQQRREPFLISRCPEWQLLRSPEMAVSASVTGDQEVQYPEEMRTAATLFAQDYLHFDSKENWENLTAQQPPELKLLPTTYSELSRLSKDAVPDNATFVALQFINLVHDIGKNPKIMHAVGLNPLTDSHDEALSRLFLPDYIEQQREFLPTFSNPAIFSSKQRRLIEGCLTTEFNFTRFLQSQCSQNEVNSINNIDDDILRLVILHGIHDIAGAMGHKQVDSSLTLDSPTSVRILDAAYALLAPADKFDLPEDTPVTPRMRSLAYLNLRASRLGIDVQDLTEFMEASDVMAQLNIANLFRCMTPQDFAPLEAAYKKLPKVLTTAWAVYQSLSLLSDRNTESYGMEYAPAFLRSLAQKGSDEHLYRVLGYFSQVFLHAMSLEPFEEPFLTSEPQSLHYDQINFYHLARWCSKNKPDGQTTISVIYNLSGNTITPVPVEADANSTKNKVFFLVNPEKFRTSTENT